MFFSIGYKCIISVKMSNDQYKLIQVQIPQIWSVIIVYFCVDKKGMHHVSDPEWQVNLGARPPGYLPTFSGASREFSGPMQEKRSQITKGDNSQHRQRSEKEGQNSCLLSKGIIHMTIGERVVHRFKKKRLRQKERKQGKSLYHKKPWEYH